jgi:hypothetical protein
MNPSSKNLLLLLAGTILLLFLAVFVFTRPAILSSFDISDKGEIGDVIGGITAPVVGLLGSFLVYLSFYQQLQANKLQREAISNEAKRAQNLKEFSSLLDLYKSIKDDFNSLVYISALTDNANPPIGRTAIFQLAENIDVYGNRPTILSEQHIIRDYLYLLGLVDLLFERIHNSTIEERDKELTTSLVLYLFYSKLRVPNQKLSMACRKHNVLPTLVGLIDAIEERARTASSSIKWQPA